MAEERWHPPLLIGLRMEKKTKPLQLKDWLFDPDDPGRAAPLWTPELISALKKLETTKEVHQQPWRIQTAPYSAEPSAKDIGLPEGGNPLFQSD